MFMVFILVIAIIIIIVDVSVLLVNITRLPRHKNAEFADMTNNACKVQTVYYGGVKNVLILKNNSDQKLPNGRYSKTHENFGINISIFRPE